MLLVVLDGEVGLVLAPAPLVFPVIIGMALGLAFRNTKLFALIAPGLAPAFSLWIASFWLDSAADLDRRSEILLSVIFCTFLAGLWTAGAGGWATHSPKTGMRSRTDRNRMPRRQHQPVLRTARFG
jgi:hypothetical protein